MIRLAAIAALLACHALAGEYALLVTGFRIYADRYERDGDKYRLYNGEGVTELDAAQVVGFEPEEYRPAAPAVAETEPKAELDPRQVVHAAAERYGLPPEFVHSVARAESGYRVDAVSPKGAIGLMQLMPGTAQALGADPNDPVQNAEAGARYLRELLLKYQDHPYQVRMALAAYNAGPGAVDRHKGVPPYRETRKYVERVIKQYRSKP